MTVCRAWGGRTFNFGGGVSIQPSGEPPKRAQLTPPPNPTETDPRDPQEVTRTPNSAKKK